MPEAEKSASEDDAAWLLADFQPVQHAQTAAVTADPIRAASVPDVAPAVDHADPPIEIPSPPRPRVASTSPWLAVGSAFQPLAGQPLILRTEAGSRPAARIVAEAGCTVHAVLAGTVHRSGTGLELRVPDGRVVGYRGNAVIEWTAGDGESVPAGAVLGWVSATEVSHPLSTMLVFLDAADGAAVDPVGWLAGLPDPRELGIVAGVAGAIDPFRIDLRLAGHLADSDGPS